MTVTDSAEKQLGEKITKLDINITSINTKLDHIVTQQGKTAETVDNVQRNIAKIEGDLGVLAEKNKRVHENKVRIDDIEKKVEVMDNKLMSTMHNVNHNVKNWEKIIDWAAKILIGIGMLYFAYKLDMKVDADSGDVGARWIVEESVKV